MQCLTDKFFFLRIPMNLKQDTLKEIYTIDMASENCKTLQTKSENREKVIYCPNNRFKASISVVKMKAGIYWNGIFKVLRNNNVQPRKRKC